MWQKEYEDIMRRRKWNIHNENKEGMNIMETITEVMRKRQLT